MADTDITPEVSAPGQPAIHPTPLGKANVALRGFVGGVTAIALLGLAGQGMQQTLLTH